MGPCWIWTGGTYASANGKLIYGRFVTGPRDRQLTFAAHRVSFALANPGFPWRYSKETELDHKCRQPICVNPSHLEVVTHRENMMRGDWRLQMKLDEQKIKDIRVRYASGQYSYAQLGVIYEVSRYTIRGIVKRRYWKHVA